MNHTNKKTTAKKERCESDLLYIRGVGYHTRSDKRPLVFALHARVYFVSVVLLDDRAKGYLMCRFRPPRLLSSVNMCFPSTGDTLLEWHLHIQYAVKTSVCVCVTALSVSCGAKFLRCHFLTSPQSPLALSLSFALLSCTFGFSSSLAFPPTAVFEG